MEFLFFLEDSVVPLLRIPYISQQGTSSSFEKSADYDTHCLLFRRQFLEIAFMSELLTCPVMHAFSLSV